MEKLMFVFLVAVTFVQQNAHAELTELFVMNPPSKVSRLGCLDRKISQIEMFLATLDVKLSGGRLATLIKSKFCKPDFKDVKVKITSTERLTGEGFDSKQISPFEQMLLTKKGGAYITVSLRQCTPENSPSIFSKQNLDELRLIAKAIDAKAKSRGQKRLEQCVGTFKEDPRRSAARINWNRSAPGHRRVSEQKSPEATM
jgi:hypothetical protein